MIFGSVDYRIEGDSFTRLYRGLIERRIPTSNMRESQGSLFLQLSYEYCKRFEKLCGECDCTAIRLRHKGFVKILRTLKRRPGIIAGIIASATLCSYYSNVVMRLTVLSDDDEIRSKVMSVLESEGVCAGTYIPDIDYAVVERALMKHIDQISWAGISRDGNGLVIDVLENIPMPESAKTRLPSNLVACENGVIEKIDILDGQIKICVGSGVTKGDVIVSGEIVTSTSSWVDGKEEVETKTTYARSIGSVYGTFERVMTFEQPFEERVRIQTGRTEEVKYLNFFSADIPLFVNMPQGYFTSELTADTAEIFGIKLPFGITSAELTEYDFTTTVYTQQEALAAVGEKAYKYEQNFLSDYELKDRKCETKVTDTGVTQTITYTLSGVMSKEAEFFIPKQR